MQTIAQLEAEHAKKLAELKREHAMAQKFIDAGLPAPDFVGGWLYGSEIAYFRKAGNLADAVALFERFERLVPFNVLRDSSCILTPEKYFKPGRFNKNAKRDTGRQSSDYAVKIDVNYIADSPRGGSASLDFWAFVGDTLFRIEIEFGTGYIGSCPQLLPVRQVQRDFRNHLISQTFNANSMLYGMADTMISWSSGDMGPIKKSAQHTYLFVADHADDEGKASDIATHALAQLRSVSENMGE